VQVDVTVDGWGSPDLSTAFIRTLCEAGVRLHVFDPARGRSACAPKVLRRLHRKIVVVDGQVAFIGGINYSADHLADYGPEAKQDWSTEVRGPIVADIHRFAHAALAAGSRHSHHRHWWRWRRQARPAPEQLPQPGSARAVLVIARQRLAHHRHRAPVPGGDPQSARKRIVIANAYFFPGYRLLRDLRAPRAAASTCA
jgi:cardiolipin synthase